MARILVFGSLAASLITFRGAMLKEMVGLGHQVYALAPDASADVKDALSKLGVVYTDLKLDRAGKNPFRDVWSIVEVMQYFNKIKPDIFLGYTIKPVIYGSLAAKFAGVPSIYSMVTGLGYAFTSTGIKSAITGYFAKWLYSISLRFNRNIFFQNPDDINVFISKGILKNNEKTVLINGSGVDLDVFRQAPILPSISFLLIARLIKEKGIYEFVESARTVRKKYPNVKFKLVGFLDKNPRSISEYDLQSWIESGEIDYKGYMKDVRPAIEESSVYVLPSYYREGIPRSILEAMAMGRPIITSDAPGCRETVQEGRNGFLVPVKNVSALVDAITYFVEHPEEVVRMGGESRQIAIEKYDVHKVNAKILNIMELV